ncbi:NAD-dependent epimerase/dehydratase family protein [Hydrogenophaga sp. PAMC20947]|uniref:NAD-dependent epimerase/dehydratase family protein n=1 Tax=Hydrogenophaga sp. PAMC20947 TaxID=2565558 RepID=UPI00109DE4E1|nr:NAD-dependent epimerase/dehydratase family protein [Hydrogenophaga sp. PAMC20947]QCB46352.1 NAD-dependent epimerase/dehydratase family protein [Hydrogenophaga sp. PAMC20947]
MIAITGATGFVGSALSKHLLMQGTNVRRLVRTQTKDPQGADVVVGDIGPDTPWTQALAGVDCVIHCAARVHVMADGESDPLAAYRRVNTLGTAQLAESAAARGVRRLIFLSSIKVLGEQTPANQPFHANSPAQPQDAYGQSKWEAEQAVADIAQRTGLEVVIVRPPLVYGPGVGANFRALAKAVQRGLPLPLASIQNHRSLVGLSNLLDLLALCIHHPGAVGQTFLVSDGADLSTPELVRQMAAALNTGARLVPFPVAGLRLAGRLAGRSAQVSRLTESLQVEIGDTTRKLDWRPPCSITEELVRTFKTLNP